MAEGDPLFEPIDLNGLSPEEREVVSKVRADAAAKASSVNLEAQATSWFAANFKPEDEVSVLILGACGNGKSSLIRRFFGVDNFKKHNIEAPVVDHGRPVTTAFKLFRLPLKPVRLWDSMGQERGDDAQMWKSSVKDHLTSLNASPTSRVHCVWYTSCLVQGRWEDADTDNVKNLLASLPVIVILTKADLATPSQISKLSAAVSSQLADAPNFKGVLVTGEAKRQPPECCLVCKDEDIILYPKKQMWNCRQDKDHAGQYLATPDDLPKLHRLTRMHIPESAQKGFDAAQVVDLRFKIPLAVGVILTAVGSATIVGVSPIPFSDSILLAPIQTTMLVALAVVIGVPLWKYPRTLAVHFAGQVATSIVGLGLASLLKFIPGLNIAAMAIDGTVAGCLTLALGILYTVSLFKIHPLLDGIEAHLPPEEMIGSLMSVTSSRVIALARSFENKIPTREAVASIIEKHMQDSK
jgi:uncharacterized protein (DUF697 family)